jgi:hypothetical protein
MADFLHSIPLADWLDHLRGFLDSPRILELAAVQVAVIVAMVALCWGIRLLTRPWTRGWAATIEQRFPNWRIAVAVHRDAPLLCAWLLLAVAARTGAEFSQDWRLVQIAADIAALWLVLRLSTLVLRDVLVGRLIATVARASAGAGIARRNRRRLAVTRRCAAGEARCR